jgi:AcrR family transcriptional regulator
VSDADTEVTDGRRVRGSRTRRSILRASAAIASEEGLDGVSLARLAHELGISKAGVYAHFDSKEDLQLATIAAARQIFVDAVVTPALAAPPGIGRLWALCERWLDYVARDVFPGGCFFLSAGAEFDSRPGPVRAALAEARRAWLALYGQLATEAHAAGDLIDVDPRQLAFELDALAIAANVDRQLLDDPDALERAGRGMRARLRSVATPAADLPEWSDSP